MQFDADPPDVAGPETVRTTVEVGNFGAEYLPMPWFPVTAEVSGDNWRYDPKTLAVVAVGTGRATATRGLTYETTSVRMPMRRCAFLGTLTLPSGSRARPLALTSNSRAMKPRSMGFCSASPAAFDSFRAGNVVDGDGVLLDAEGNLVINTVPGHVVSLTGVSDMVVVHTPDATLVTTLAGAENVKDLVAQVASQAGARYV